MMTTTRKLAEVLHATNPAHAGCERRYDEHGPGGGAYYERWADAILASGAIQQGSLYSAFMAGAAACYDIPAPRVLNAAYERYTARHAADTDA